MWTYSVLVLLATVSLVFVSGELRCLEQSFDGFGGVFPSPYSHQEYSRCVEGVVQTVPCPNGHYFDTKTQSCQFEQSVESVHLEVALQFEELCNNPDVVQIFPNPTNCTQYVICYGTVPIVQTCSNGLLFNPLLNTCDVPGNVVCGYSCPNEDDPFNPVWLPDARLEDCSRHYLCFKGEPLQFYCYNNLYFDIETRTCTYPQYSACRVPNVYCNTTFTTNIENPRSCNSFYTCIDGFPHYRTCEFNEYFSVQLGVCVPGACPPDTTTTVLPTITEPTSTTVSSGTTPSFTSTTDWNTQTTDFSSTTVSISTNPSDSTSTVPESTTLVPSTLEPTTSSVPSTSTISPTTFEISTIVPSTTELTTGGETITPTIPDTSTIPPTTFETSTFVPSTPELTTDSPTTTTVFSTSTMSPTTIETSTFVPSTPELTTGGETITPTTADSSTMSPTTIETSTFVPSTPELTTGGETITPTTADTSTMSPTTIETSTFVPSTPELTTGGETITPTIPDSSTMTPTTVETSTIVSSTPEPTTQEATTTSTESATTTTELTTTTPEPTTTPIPTTTTEMVTIDPNEACVGLGIAILPYPGNCYMYIVCVSGLGGLSECKANEIFNPVALVCVPGNQQTCTPF
uniref:Chitin-binding type-2 domain-containing protein n=1 Tax=Anopheles christyi TaxID=43041 RepID=A0A182K4V3_9DIPT